jgi:hypothetical protein
MPVPAGELRVQIAMTAAFINTRPVDVILTPHAFVDDGSGGKKKTASPSRPPQRIRFIEDGITTRFTEIGKQYVQAANILALPGTAIAVDDEFTWEGGLWRVDAIQFPNEWSVRATVLRYGR